MNASLTTVQTAREIFQHHAKSFWLASMFLPSDRRDDAAVVYAFCRLVDDSADEAPSLSAADEALTAIAEELSGISNPRPIIAAFLETSSRLELPLSAARDLMVGVRTDLLPVRVKDDWHLAQYSYRVAGTVGLLMCGVLGVKDRKAHQFAVELGIGMQLTNICRDVLEDAHLGRVYLPGERLEKAGGSSDEVLSLGISKQVRTKVVGEILDLADICYKRADYGMRYIPLRTRIAIVVASRVYRSIGHKLRRVHHSDPFHGRTIVSKIGRWWQVFLALLQLMSPVVLGLKKQGAPSQRMFSKWSDLSGE